MERSRRADAVVFGFDFQVNAAIVLFLENIEEVENDYYVEINHEMTKDHFISFVAYVTYDRVLLIKLYPEQSPTVRFPRLCGKFERGKFYMYCNQHGLLMKGR